MDLYSGVGGWSLGLRLAGIDVVASYERWDLANETNFKNNRHQAQTIDIRRLALDDLPSSIDIVVGSPPCTEFSFSNRGGNGDIADGLEDIRKFLTIVQHLKPKFWAMENVPRVARILESELQPGGLLEEFRHLGLVPHIVNMEDFGVPQRRRRCVAGNFDFTLLTAYSKKAPKRTLGQVVRALTESRIRDPIYGLYLDRQELSDHIEESPLNEEEVRINRAGKMLHPVYNTMSFPDSLGRSVRTITATCTRVSRESIVIESPNQPGSYRRLTVRERACLQGFPITFQFYGKSYGEKLRMVGNAIPPSFAYYVAHALQTRSPDDVKPLTEYSNALKSPIPLASDAPPERPGSRYTRNRTFRFAIPSLRLMSGVRFELANNVSNGDAFWGVSFYFGTSKSIKSLSLDGSLYDWIFEKMPAELRQQISPEIAYLSDFVDSADVVNMQRIWSHSGVGLTRPFMLLDVLDECGTRLTQILSRHEVVAQTVVGLAIWNQYGESALGLPGLSKLARNAPQILAGLLVGTRANDRLRAHGDKVVRPQKEAAAG
ncbi:BsaWI methylase [Burkholderia pseudomallei]|uniref:DNA cytosine methyltransferase n=1 Tax=Burkholderia pseudomallei TaxID=28450 RepID=UPI000B067FA2|nr:DNA (cytosine-5-)-methyltransferase [Burkholderia pseudomallei]MBO7797161.1 DNA (cytosine-5-)-methyltransferase [Burkholderia pseudomallei]MBO7815350.1 DNA (cytosine-5-)-methyltransferase [Burkholderia pseudomallei]CAJ4526869.1 BsaWI methylase [Burkholderia pseudomallei]CAJ5824737.1 BsaWI methylase [Burkholderia pseudomallei]CAJ5889235.1 BsaWI methylase [Burkholderia pseudomallei]